jgi:nucleotide-binding universal stress UspA family protein
VSVTIAKEIDSKKHDLDLQLKEKELMYTNILVPLDGSPFAESALPHAAALAGKFACKITLITVFETPHVYQAHLNGDDGVLNDIHQGALRQASDYLDEVKSNLDAEGLSVDIIVREGDNIPALILETTEESGADLVVMSTHGRSGLDQWRFGSVAQRVARHCSVPVVLVQPCAENE